MTSITSICLSEFINAFLLNIASNDFKCAQNYKKRLISLIRLSTRASLRKHLYNADLIKFFSKQAIALHE